MYIHTCCLLSLRFGIHRGTHHVDGSRVLSRELYLVISFVFANLSYLFNFFAHYVSKEFTKMRWRIPTSYVFGSAVATVVGVGYLTKDYMGGSRYKGNETIADKIVIVTGANTGIGKEIAHEMARRKARVVMACRNMEKCERTRRIIVLDTENKYVYCRQCDLASQESIKKFVEQFKKESSKLHILINNAGVMRCPKNHTKEGIEMQLGVNHMGHFLLTNLLLDTLKASAPARIVNLSSSAHRRGQIKMKDLNSDEDYDPGKAYAQSKLAILLFTRELANRLKGTGVTVNAVHPGVVDTNLTRHMFVYQHWYTKMFLIPFSWPFIKSPVQGMQTILYAALDPSLADTTGCYFDNCATAEVSDEAKNDDVARWLWKVSEKWTRLNIN